MRTTPNPKINSWLSNDYVEFILCMENSNIVDGGMSTLN
jgi:hypothetical protein